MIFLLAATAACHRQPPACTSSNFWHCCCLSKSCFCCLLLGDNLTLSSRRYRIIRLSRSLPSGSLFCFGLTVLPGQVGHVCLAYDIPGFAFCEQLFLLIFDTQFEYSFSSYPSFRFDLDSDFDLALLPLTLELPRFLWDRSFDLLRPRRATDRLRLVLFRAPFFGIVCCTLSLID